MDAKRPWSPSKGPPRSPALRQYGPELAVDHVPGLHSQGMQLGEEPVGDERFSKLLGGFLKEHIEQHEGSVIGLLPDLTIGYLNPAWFRFARDNEAEDVADRWGLWPMSSMQYTGPRAPSSSVSISAA